MKKNALMMSVALAAMLCAPSVSAKSLKVLMIGNSFSHCIIEEWPRCAASAGDTLDLASLFIGACSLSKHWENVEKSSDPDYLPYVLAWNYASAKEKSAAPVARLGGKTNIPQALVADKWDIVTIQQVSISSPFPESYEPFAGKLIAKIRELAPQAEVVVQETWSYAPYDRRLKKTPAEMHAAIKKAYAQLAARYQLRTIPTGDAVQLYRQRLPVDYGKLLTDAEIAAIREPALMDFHGDVVGSSRWGKGSVWNKDKDVYRLRLDSIHLNKEGQYLQALVWQATLFGTDVAKLTYRPDHISAEKASLMRTCAMDAVNAYRKAKSAGTPLFDPVASSDGRFWRDVDGVRWRAVEVPAGATSFELPVRRYLPEFEEAEILIDVRLGEGVSLKKGDLRVTTLPGVHAIYNRGATVLFDVPGATDLKAGNATLRIPLDCRALPRDGKPAFPARIDAVKFTCDKSDVAREVLYRDVRIDKKGFFAELSVGNGDFLVGDLDDPARNDPHFTLVNASSSPCEGLFAYVVRHQANGEVERRTINRTFAPNERFRVDLPRLDKCFVYYVDTTIGRLAENNAFSYSRTYSYGAMHPVRHPRMAKDGEFRFSMCTHFNHYPWEEQIRMADYMEYAGLNCSRGGPTTYWCFKSPNPGDWHENQVCDRLTDELIARGIEPMGGIGYPSDWAVCKEPKSPRNYPRSLDEYEKFCERYVREKKGKVRIFECFNEPNLGNYWTVDLYGAYEAAAYRGLKKGNPDALLKSGEWGGFTCHAGLSPDLYYAKYKDNFDIMAFHYHMFFEQDVGSVQHVKSIIKNTGVTQPWFADECARGTCDDHLSALTYFRKLIHAWANGAIGYTWYNLRMKGWGAKDGEMTFGIITPDFGPREAYLTCNMICGTFQGAKFVKELVLKPDMMSFRFERADTDVALVPFWGMSRNFGMQTVFARTDAKRAELIDIVGNVTPLEIRDGIVSLPVGLDPYTLRLAGAKSTLERVAPLTESDRVLVFGSGAETKAKFTVHNPYAAPVKWKMSVATPDSVKAAPDAVELAIPAGGSAPLDVAFAVGPAFRSDADSQAVRVAVTGDGFNGITEFKTFPAARATPNKGASFKATSRELYVSFIEGLPDVDHLYWQGIEDLGAHLYVFYPGNDVLHLRVCVDDDKHVPVMDPKRTYEGDGLQLLLSLPEQAGMWEINLAVSEDLKKSVCSVETAPVGFDGDALGSKVRIRAGRNEKVPQKTLWYNIELPFKDFGISREALLREGLRWNVMVNDRDFDRREGYMSMVPGDRSNPPKNPDKFPLVVFGQDEQ